MLKDIRAINQFYGKADSMEVTPQTVTGKMGNRNRDTGYYDTELNNDGIAPGRFIGLSNSIGQGVTTELDLNTPDYWADN